jgi:hypothetical protein
MKSIKFCLIFFSLIFFLSIFLIEKVCAGTAEQKKGRNMKYLVYYGEWDSEKISRVFDFDLVILHPGNDLENITPEMIEEIKNGRDGMAGTDDDIMVIAYVSIGEDERVPRGAGNIENKEEGPVFYDKGLNYVENDYPSRYVDQVSYVFNEKGFFNYLPGGLPEIFAGHDGLPDENGKWGSYFVNPGDPLWQDMIKKKMEKLSDDFGVDGFFLDTLDTASPWGNYGWTQENMALLVKKIREDFPDKYLIANRGFFLLEKYADIFRSSIDGIMFESFVSEWDWYRNTGIESPYAAENYKVLKNTLVPEMKKKDGFHLFVLDYLSPEQKDFYNIFFNGINLLEDTDYSYYISTPDLQKIFPPAENYFSEDYRIPSIQELNAEESEKGHFAVYIRLQDENNLLPGEDYFIDLRYGEKDSVSREISLLKKIEIDYEKTIILNGSEIKCSSYGLDKDTDYYIYVKLIGKNPSIQTPYCKTFLHTTDGTYPGVIYSLQGEGRESSVYLTWEKESEKSNIYTGDSPDNLNFLKTVTGNSAVVDNLINGKIYYFSLSALSETGQEGPIANPVTVCPKDCTPPPPPEGLYVEYDKETEKLHITWNPVICDDLSCYRLYCFPSEQKIRLPLIIPSHMSEIFIDNLSVSHSYKIFITSVDYNNNQSNPCEIKEIFIGDN